MSIKIRNLESEDEDKNNGLNGILSTDFSIKGNW